jgi:hypothetical protein
MANAEQNRNFAEKGGDFVKRLGIVGGLIGIIGMIAGMKFGETLFVGGVVAGSAGFAAEKLAGSGKK